MKCLHKMFASRPKPTSLPADLNAQIISVFILAHKVQYAVLTLPFNEAPQKID